jgi:hypothetical protein
LANYPNLVGVASPVENRFYRHWCEDTEVKRAMKQQHIR